MDLIKSASDVVRDFSCKEPVVTSFGFVEEVVFVGITPRRTPIAHRVIGGPGEGLDVLVDPTVTSVKIRGSWYGLDHGGPEALLVYRLGQNIT